SGSNRLRTSVSLSIKISIGYLLQSADVVVNRLSRSPPNSTRLTSVYTWRQSYNKLTLEHRCHNSKEWEEEPCQIPVSKLTLHQMRGRADLSAIGERYDVRIKKLICIIGPYRFPRRSITS